MTATTDLSKFGYKEWEELRKIVDAMLDHGLPKDFERDGLHPMFNMNSGNVFLTNSEYQVAMLNGEKLESFYSCPECGHEGFLEEIGKENGHGYADGCWEWVKEITGQYEGK
jgi:hypothetical protein